jgi:preprotein translocase subunit SecF
MMNIRKFNIDFFKYVKLTATVSFIFVIGGLIAGVMMWNGKNVGIDFKGGNAITVKFNKKLSIGEIRTLSEKSGISFDIAHFPDVDKAILKTQLVDVGGKKVSNIIEEVYAKELGKDGYLIEGIVEIGPKVGNELKKDATIAFLLSAVGIILYLAWRFEWKFGLAAAIATYHDVIAMVAFMFFLGYEMDLMILTALLTIAGYSLTDTVVVFDRIRENLRKKGVADPKGTINFSINEVLSRTIITSLTTLLAAVAILIFGGEVLRSFALAISVGIVVGTYSSIFIASPLLVAFKLDPRKLKK